MIFDYTVITRNIGAFASGFGCTLEMMAMSLPISAAAAVLIAAARGSRIAPLRWIARTLVEIVRNVPFLVQAFLIFFGLPFYGLDLGAVPAGLICLALYGAVYFSEAIRGAIASVARGQWEASFALGLTPLQNLRWVIMPQLPPYLVPAATNVSITLLKETALLAVITVPELTYMTESVVGKEFAPMEGYLVVALAYWFTSECIARVMRRVERWSRDRYTVPRPSVNASEVTQDAMI